MRVGIDRRQLPSCFPRFFSATVISSLLVPIHEAIPPKATLTFVINICYSLFILAK